MKRSFPFPGIRVTTNGNQLVSYYTESRLAEAGVFYPITPSTEMGELFQQSFAQGGAITVENEKGSIDHLSLSRQMTIFCVERRKAWRLLQSHAGIEKNRLQGPARPAGQG